MRDRERTGEVPATAVAPPALGARGRLLGDVGYFHWLCWYLERARQERGRNFTVQSSYQPDFDIEEELRDGWAYGGEG